jgi:hypothetical protein
MPSDFTVSWNDGDGDEVVIRSDNELQIALTEMAAANPKKGQLTYKFTVKHVKRTGGYGY